MKKSLLSLAFLSICSIYSFGQMTISGTYTGKNVFIENPIYDLITSQGCTDKIVINGEEYSGEFVSQGNEIKLDSFNLKVGDAVKIEIFHKDGCEPKLLNAESLQTSEK